MVNFSFPTSSEIGENLDDVDLKVRLRSKEWSEEEIVIQSALKRVTGKYTQGSMVEWLNDWANLPKSGQ